jgi:serine/threonine-protein kinase
MDTHRWHRIQRLFTQALAVAPDARAEWLRTACGEDAELLHELQALLAHDDASQHTLEKAVRSQAGAILAQVKVQRTGERFGSWEIVEHIADGGMGAVYLARRADGAFEQMAALKLLSPALLGVEGRRRLEAERHILAGLNHPNIARLLDGGSTADGVPYMLMELVDGLPIDDYCNVRGLDTTARLQLFLRVCDAVDYAHRNLVVHRDIKPANLLVTADGTPKLLDFGISKLLDPADPSLTAADQRLFTPARASPEQICGGPITTATDVYALGVLLHELLAGSLPFAAAGRTPAQIAQDILHTEPGRPSLSVQHSSQRLLAAQQRGEALTAERLRRELDGDLDNIVLMALRKEPARRYASVPALADDVRCVLEHRPVKAQADSWVYRTGKFVRRHRAGVVASSVMALLLAGLSGVYLHRLDAERTLAQRERATAQQVTAFLSELFENASPEVQGKAELTVREMVDGAAGRVDRELAGQAEVQLELLRILGRVYRHLGQWQASADALQRAVDLARAAQLPPSAQLGRTWAELSNTLSQLAMHEAAIAAARETTPIFRVALGENDYETVESMFILVTKLATARRYEEADELLKPAAAAIARVADAADRQDLAYQLAAEEGKVLAGRGQWLAAAAAFERALSLRVDDGKADGSRDAVTARLALAQMSGGRFDEALRTLDASRERIRAQAGGEHRRVLMAHNLKSRVHWQAGDMPAAEREARLALAGWQVQGGGEVPAAAMALNLGQALWGQGRLDEARAVLKQALAQLTPEADAGHGAPLRVALGGVEVDAGQVEAGLRRMMNAIPEALHNGTGRAGAEILHLMLPLLRAQLAAGKLDDAHRLLAALDRESLARRPPQATFAWRLAWLEARLAWAAGDADAARDMLLRARRELEAMAAVAPWVPAVQTALEAMVAGQAPDPFTQTVVEKLAPSDCWRVLLARQGS